MKKGIICILGLFIGVIFSSCGTSKYQEINLTDSSKIKEFEYEKSDTLVEEIQINIVRPKLPEGAYITGNCFYDNIFYYAIEYTDYLADQTGEKGNIPFEEKYNTQIRAFYLDSQEDILIYQYDEKKCIQVTDVQCNGNQVVWEDYNQLEDTSWGIKKITLKQDEEPETITSASIEGGDMWSVTLTITSDGLYWYNAPQFDENKSFSLFRYDFKTEKVDIVQEGITLTSPYEHYVELNKAYTTYSKKIGTDKYVIHTYNKSNNRQIDLLVDGLVSDPITNGKICVWMRGYDVSQAQEIFIYDFESRTLEKINATRIFSYALVKDYLIINNNNEKIICYDIQNKKYADILSAEGSYYGYTNQGLDNIVLTEIINTDNKHYLSIK